MTGSSEGLVLGSWLAMIVLATVRQVASSTPGLPSPAVYVGSGVLFSLFYLGAKVTPQSRLFGVLAVGAVVTALVKPYLHRDASGQSVPILNSGPLFQVSNLLDQMSGAAKPGSGPQT
jgi:hypothetical protein